jgi:hypothetical protein
MCPTTPTGDTGTPIPHSPSSPDGHEAPRSELTGRLDAVLLNPHESKTPSNTPTKDGSNPAESIGGMPTPAQVVELGRRISVGFISPIVASQVMWGSSLSQSADRVSRTVTGRILSEPEAQRLPVDSPHGESSSERILRQFDDLVAANKKLFHSIDFTATEARLFGASWNHELDRITRERGRLKYRLRYVRKGIRISRKGR